MAFYQTPQMYPAMHMPQPYPPNPYAAYYPNQTRAWGPTSTIATNPSGSWPVPQESYVQSRRTQPSMTMPVPRPPTNAQESDMDLQKKVYPQPMTMPVPRPPTSSTSLNQPPTGSNRAPTSTSSNSYVQPQYVRMPDVARNQTVDAQQRVGIFNRFNAIF